MTRRIERAMALLRRGDLSVTDDLGPGAGHDGGRSVFEGTPADLVAGRGAIPSVTGEHLAAYVGA
jgi:excinuclease UvrABC ATPase subunit